MSSLFFWNILLFIILIMKEIIAFYPITKSPGVHSTDAETPNVYVEPPFLLSVGDSVAGNHIV